MLLQAEQSACRARVFCKHPLVQWKKRVCRVSDAWRGHVSCQFLGDLAELIPACEKQGLFFPGTLPGKVEMWLHTSPIGRRIPSHPPNPYPGIEGCSTPLWESSLQGRNAKEQQEHSPPRRARAESEPRGTEDVRNGGKAPCVHSREREGGSR